jgi:hypothetical protein
MFLDGDDLRQPLGHGKAGLLPAPEYNGHYADPFAWTWTNDKMRNGSTSMQLDSLHNFRPEALAQT